MELSLSFPLWHRVCTILYKLAGNNKTVFIQQPQPEQVHNQLWIAAGWFERLGGAFGCGTKHLQPVWRTSLTFVGRKLNKHSLSDRKGFAAMHNHQDTTSGEKICFRFSPVRTTPLQTKWQSNIKADYKQGCNVLLKLISILPFFWGRAPHICRQACTCPLDILSPQRFQPGLLWATWHVIAATHIWQRHF